MSELEFEGFVEELTPRVRQFFTDTLVKQGYRGTRVLIEPVGKIGDNYGADVRRIIAEENGQSFKMVAKMTPAGGEMWQAMCNEVVMYSEILPELAKIEEEASVPEQERLKYAKYYGSLLGNPCDILILEDLQVDEYVMMDKLKSLSNEAVRLVLKSLAALHSLSFALKTKEPETYNSLKDKLFGIWEIMLKMENCLTHFQGLEDDILQIITEDKYKNEIKGRLGKFPQLLIDAYKEDNESKYAVFIHGDCWTNNIMFQVKNDEPISCCMIDYPISTTANPAADIGYMIFNCTDHETRIKHYHSWITYYHSQLDNYLSYHGLKANMIYPKDQLDGDIKRYGKIIIAQISMSSTVIIRDSSDAAKVKDAIGGDGPGNFVGNMTEAMKMTSLSETTIAKYKNRVTKLIDSHLELGII